MKQTEIDKLEKILLRNDIPFTRIVETNRNQILFKQGDINLYSAICHRGSYGYLLGLIELWDFQNEPIGDLKAKDAYNIIKTHYGKI